MADFKCSSCGASFHSSAELEFIPNTNCLECGGALAPAPAEDRKVRVLIGGAVCEIRESALKEQIRKNYQRSGFIHALRFYRSLFPDVGYSDAKDTVLAWCGNLKEGCVMLV
jgi:hypothetical protein